MHRARHRFTPDLTEARSARRQDGDISQGYARGEYKDGPSMHYQLLMYVCRLNVIRKSSIYPHRISGKCRLHQLREIVQAVTVISLRHYH